MKQRLLSLLFIFTCLCTSAQVSIIDAEGWHESAYLTWEHYAGADMYNVYVKSSLSSSWTQLDRELIRNYGYYGRADVVGIAAGNYQFKIEATQGGSVLAGSEATSGMVVVEAYDRAGFAHLDGAAVGAYKNDGTLKENARILYIDNTNVDKVTLPVLNGKSETTCTGLGEILKAHEKGLETRPLAIRFVGNINTTSGQLYGDADAMQLKGKANNIPMNITFEGIGDDAYLSDWGLVFVNCNNVEVRNLGVMLFNDDGISLKESVKVWVHHCDIFYGKAGSASDQAKGDGSLDAKDDSQYCTFSYNHFWDAGKMALCGMKSETGPNYMSYHHNWFDHSDSRHPRVRRMSIHVYNNYYDGISKYGVGATSGSSIFVESNFYRNTNRPMMSSLQGTDATGDGTFSGEDGGMIKSYGNIFVECGSNFSYITANSVENSGATAVNATSYDAYHASSRNEQVPASFKTLKGGTTYDNFDTNSALMYTYTPDAAIEVPAKVKSQAGRMQGGDFTWIGFDNAAEDYNYDINSSLMSAVKNYKSSLVEIGAFTQKSAAPASYTVTYYADVAGTVVYEKMTQQRRIVYPQGTPTQEGYTFTGWSAIRGASIKGDVNVYPSFSDGVNSNSGSTTSGTTTTEVKRWDFTTWSSSTQNAIKQDAAWVQNETFNRYDRSFDTATELGFAETEGISFKGKVRISWDDSKGKNMQGSFTMYVPVEPGQVITVNFSNTGSSNGSRDLLIDGNVVASSSNTTHVEGSYTIPEGVTSVSVVGSGGLNYYGITLSEVSTDEGNEGDEKEKEKPTFAFSATSATVDLSEEEPLFPTLTNTSNGTVTYSSSNTAVAIIDANGVVTPLAEGTTTIRATVSETDTYTSATAQYQLTVTDASAPAYTVTFMVDDAVYETMYDQRVVTYPATTPSKEGYIFTGWDVAAGTAVTQDMEIHAIFEEAVAESITLKAGTFPEGYAIDGETSGELYTYSDNTKAKEVFKLEKGEHTVTIPSGMIARRVEFYGCAQNNDSREGITQFNGTSQSTTFVGRKSNELTTVTFNDLNIVNSFTFTLGYNSAVKIYIDVEPQSTSNAINQADENNIRYNGKAVTADGLIIIYNLQGIALLTGEDRIEMSKLPRGIYIVRNGTHTLKVVK